jgi:hypothetical protein
MGSRLDVGTDDGVELDVDPIVDLGLFPSDQVPADWTAVRLSPGGSPADLSSASHGGTHLLLAYRRDSVKCTKAHMPGFIMDICVVFLDKEETIPPNYVKVASCDGPSSSPHACRITCRNAARRWSKPRRRHRRSTPWAAARRCASSAGQTEARATCGTARS